jgi:hypothetical protein
MVRDMKAQDELRKNYSWEQIEFDETKGYPFGNDLFYECQFCRQLVQSCPDKADRDKAFEYNCNNLIIDADAGRIY